MRLLFSHFFILYDGTSMSHGESTVYVGDVCKEGNRGKRSATRKKKRKQDFACGDRTVWIYLIFWNLCMCFLRYFSLSNLRAGSNLFFYEQLILIREIGTYSSSTFLWVIIEVDKHLDYIFLRFFWPMMQIYTLFI
jgi:hypothetical protein